MSGHDSRAAAAAQKQIMREQATGGQRLQGSGVLGGAYPGLPSTPRGDAENFVAPQAPMPAPSSSPGYAFPATEAYGGTGTDSDYGPTLGGRLEQLARQPSPGRPESGASVRDRLNNIDRAIEILGEASISDSAAQWTAAQQMYGELKSEILRIKSYLGIS